LITADMSLEEILNRYPQAITFFVMEGVSPLCCAEVPPESLAAFLKRKKIDDVENFLKRLNDSLNDKI